MTLNYKRTHPHDRRRRLEMRDIIEKGNHFGLYDTISFITRHFKQPVDYESKLQLHRKSTVVPWSPFRSELDKRSALRYRLKENHLQR